MPLFSLGHPRSVSGWHSQLHLQLEQLEQPPCAWDPRSPQGFHTGFGGIVILLRVFQTHVTLSVFSFRRPVTMEMLGQNPLSASQNFGAVRRDLAEKQRKDPKVRGTRESWRGLGRSSCVPGQAVPQPRVLQRGTRCAVLDFPAFLSSVKNISFLVALDQLSCTKEQGICVWGCWFYLKESFSLSCFTLVQQLYF